MGKTSSRNFQGLGRYRHKKRAGKNSNKLHMAITSYAKNPIDLLSTTPIPYFHIEILT